MHVKKKYWLTIVLIAGFLLIGVLVLRSTRTVRPYTPLPANQPARWSTLGKVEAAALQATLDRDVNLLKVLGLQAFVRTSDGRTWSGASGTTDLARKKPLQRDHVLRVGSMTKTFTAIVILKLVEEGLLSLDEPIAKWFPELSSAERITIRHLLNHSSGIPEIIPKVMLKSIIPSTYWKPETLTDLITADEPKFIPGSRFDYSNSNYILLGLIAEELLSKSAAQLLHEQIIDPLDLEHTYFIPYEPAPAQLVIGFDRDLASFPWMLQIGTDDTSWATSAFTSGAMASNAEDLGIFFDQLFAGALLSPSILAEMNTFIEASNPGLPEQTGSGLGLMQLDVDGQELIGHVGQFMGSTAIAMYSPDEDYIIAVTCNLSNPDLVKILADLQESIR